MEAEGGTLSQPCFGPISKGDALGDRRNPVKRVDRQKKPLMREALSILTLW